MSICNNLFHLQRSSQLLQKRLYHSHKNGKWLKSIKIISTKEILTKSDHIRYFHVFSVRPTHKVQVQAKISTIKLVFPVFLAVSYNHGNTDNIKIAITCRNTKNWILFKEIVNSVFKGKPQCLSQSWHL